MDSRWQSWLHGLEAWFVRTKASATDPEARLTTPPEEMLTPLSRAMAQLSAPQPYVEAIQERLAAAIDHWRSHPDAENSLVFLGSPMEPLAATLQASLTDRALEGVTLMECLPGFRRLADPLDLKAQLQSALGPPGHHRDSAPADSSEPGTNSPAAALDPRQDHPRVVLVPALDQLFLRCIQGWAGIEYLQNLVVQDRHRFWVFCSNTWAWGFLDRVCQISAYLEQVERLPALEGEALQDWLGPLLWADQVRPSSASLEADPELSPGSAWDALASLSGGEGQIAAHLWLRSLRVKVEALDASQDAQRGGEEAPLQLYLSKPILPSLPSLTTLDRYLLHSLLLHGSLSRQQLTLSLGEAENQVRSRVQVLRRDGVIIQRGEWLSVHPAHYPQLRSELNNNNFLIDQG